VAVITHGTRQVTLIAEIDLYLLQFVCFLFGPTPAVPQSLAVQLDTFLPVARITGVHQLAAGHLLSHLVERLGVEYLVYGDFFLVEVGYGKFITHIPHRTGLCITIRRYRQCLERMITKILVF